MSKISTLTLATLAAIYAPLLGASPAPGAVAALKTSGCSALTFDVHPGLNPPSRISPIQIAPNSPRGHFTVSVPLYAHATVLSTDVAIPFPEVPDDPYLQTASAEYRTPDSQGKVERWFRRTFTACGWRHDGRWSGNATAFTGGYTFVAKHNANLSVEASFGVDPAGGTYIGYGVEEVILPPRPAGSYLHGRFVAMRIALWRASRANGASNRVVHTTVLDQSTIRGMVTTINSIRGYRTILGICFGGLRLEGPAWFSLVRTDGSIVHAYETGPGVCGGLAVNGVRWLTDPGSVWSRILGLTSGRG
ncbi:MAG: hypothetical protein ACR2GA_06070 [Chloroflexota bacterium]